MSAVSARAAGAVAGGAVGLLAGLTLVLPAAATAAEPLPTTGAVVGALVPSASPSPSPGPLDPVLSQLPAPVAEPVREVVGTVTGQPAPKPKPAPPAGTGAGTGVSPNSGSAPQQVSAPLTGRAALPALRGGSFFTGGSSGLAPIAAGSRSPSLDALFSVPDVAAPLAVLPQAAPASAGSSAPVPAGLPGLVVVVAVITVAGAATGQLAVLRARRTAASA